MNSPESNQGEAGEFNEELYWELQKLRSVERHEISDNNSKEETADLIEEIEEILNRIREILNQGGEEESEEPRDDELSELKRQIIGEIERLAARPEEIAKLKRESFGRLFDFMRKRKRAAQEIERLVAALDEFRKEYFEKPVNELLPSTLKTLSECEKTIEDIKHYLEEKLPLQNPESFYANSLLKLREYGRQLSSGIVETKYVQNQKERAKNTLLKNHLIALLGETGTGKTRIARKIAEELTGDYEFIAGHHFMGKEDLYSYAGIDARIVSPEDVPAMILKYQEILRSDPDFQNLPKDQQDLALSQIEEVVKGQAARPQLVTKIFQAGVLKAASEGKIVIIDEFNYIPANLLAGLNALVEAKPGERINIYGQEIEVKPGFGVIFTGNITKTEFSQRYLQREAIDPALINRLNSGLIEYGSLPQDTEKSFVESILEEEEIAKGATPPERELFEIGLALLADRYGNIAGPSDLLEKVWNLSREFSLLQKLYAGEEIAKTVKLVGGQTLALRTYHASMRTFRSIIESWKKEGYRHSLEWHIYDNLIRPASLIAPEEAGQMLILLRERAGFFADKNWQAISVDSTTFRIAGLEGIEGGREKFMRTQEQPAARYYRFSPEEVAEAMAGRRTPSLKTTEAVEFAVMREKANRYQRLEKKIKGLEKPVRQWQENLDRLAELRKSLETRKVKPMSETLTPGIEQFERFEEEFRQELEKILLLKEKLEEYKKTGDEELAQGLEAELAQTEERINQELESPEFQALQRRYQKQAKKLLAEWYPKIKEDLLDNLEFGPEGQIKIKELDLSYCNLSGKLEIPAIITEIQELNCHGNQLTELPPLPDGLQKLRCYNNQLTELPPLPDGLQWLDCNDNQLTELPKLPDGLQLLDCDNNQLTELPPLPDELQVLACSGNQLTKLPKLPDWLQWLHCSGNQLTELPPLPDGLQHLECYNNQLTKLPPLPDGLQELHCYGNQLTELPPLPDGLQELHCYGNQLTKLPKLPDGLQRLYCDNNQLTELPPLPDWLKGLDCDNNQLTELPPLPDWLQWLDCDNNQLTKLPPLPEGLPWLHCSGNQLTELPPLPDVLQELHCYGNQLTELPKLPDGLQLLDCDNNQLTELPKLPDWLQRLNCSGNQLTELPKLPDGLQELDCSGNRLTEQAIEQIKAHPNYNQENFVI